MKGFGHLFLREGIGPNILNPGKPRLGRGGKPPQKIMLAKEHGQIGAEFWHQELSLVEQCNGSWRIPCAERKILEFIDLVDIGSHGNIGNAFKNDFNHDGDAEFLP